MQAQLSINSDKSNIRADICSWVVRSPHNTVKEGVIRRVVTWTSANERGEMRRELARLTRKGKGKLL